MQTTSQYTVGTGLISAWRDSATVRSAQSRADNEQTLRRVLMSDNTVATIHPMLLKESGEVNEPSIRIVTGKMVDGTQQDAITKEDLITLGIPEGEHEWLRGDAARLLTQIEAPTTEGDPQTDTVGEQIEEPEVEKPSVEDLMIQMRDKHIGGKDKISRSQMASYLAFFSDAPEGQPLKHQLFTEVLVDLTPEELQAIAVNGKSAIGRDKGKMLDDLYVEMWNEWAGRRLEEQGISTPRSHMWIKGVVAAALAISMHALDQQNPEAGAEADAAAEAQESGAEAPSTEQEAPAEEPQADTTDAPEGAEQESREGAEA